MKYTKKCLIGLTVGLFALGFSPASEAQESKDVSGRIIGTADWHDIHSKASEFFASDGIENFRIRQKKLPDRTQEAWVHRMNEQSGSLLRMRYERLHSQSFTSQSFDRNFEQVFNSFTRRANVTFEDALWVEKAGRNFKVAWVPILGNRLCIVGLKAFGISFSDNPEAAGDKSIVLLACHQGEQDKDLLKSTILSFLETLLLDGLPVEDQSDGAHPFSFYEAKLFGTTPPTPSNDDTAAPRNLNWEERSIALQWDGMNDLVAGKILLSQSSKRGKIRATLPRAQGSCSGEYRIVSQQRGEWSLFCSNGLTASGDFEAFGAGKGSSGNGVDNEGRAIRFTVGGK